MARVKRSINAKKKRRATLELTKGFRGEAHSNYKRAKEALMKADSYAYRDPPQPQARLPPPVDHPHQRRRAPERDELRDVHARAQAGRDRAGPQGAGRHRRARRRDLPTLCRGRPRGVGSRVDREPPTDEPPGRLTEGAFFVPEMITSHHNPKLKEIRRIARRKDSRFVAEGEDLLAAADAAGWPALERYVAGENVEAEALAKVSTLGSGTRAIGVYDERWAEQPTGPLCVALWGVHAPGNVGTVLRSALAFGASTVAIGPETADPY